VAISRAKLGGSQLCFFLNQFAGGRHVLINEDAEGEFQVFQDALVERFALIKVGVDPLSTTTLIAIGAAAVSLVCLPLAGMPA
jgi:hypothetical protein